MLTIGKYEDGMFTFNTDYDHDTNDNPDFVESLDKRFVHNEEGLYFQGTETEYWDVINKSATD